MFCNLLSDSVTCNVGTNKLKNESQFSKMAGTNVYNRYKSENINSRIMTGIKLVDSMTDRKNLTVVLLKCCAGFFSFALQLNFSNKLSVTVIFLEDV